ncbi:Gypsy retrotransposon integrase-like protein 1 [Paramarasmius palmivorus]|uniref:Gypsy retrotransposon integrase-like protein 1 n=1 Tax=Paramarasmius palmivorus TaxID=297713 RepID=A0AAW0C5U7_9AGAR
MVLKEEAPRDADCRTLAMNVEEGKFGAIVLPLQEIVAPAAHPYALSVHMIYRKRVSNLSPRSQNVNEQFESPSKKSDTARSLVNAILSSSKPYSIPEDPAIVREILVDLANYARSLDRQLLLARGQPPDQHESPQSSTSPATSSMTPEPEPEVREVPDSIDSLAEDLRKISLTHSKRHFGKSSTFMLVQSAMDARRDVLGDRAFTAAALAKYQRLEFWKPFEWQRLIEPNPPELVFPEDDLMRNLIDIYFTALNPFFPLLHRPTFDRALAEGEHKNNRSFGYTVLAVCAVASRQSNDPRNLSEDTTSEHSLGWKWFRQIPIMRPNFAEPPSLYDLQLCSLSVFYLQSTSTPEAAWTIVGLGIRFAQEMGVHRRKANSTKPTVEEELWKRAFWLLISIDLFMSAFLGRPRATTPDDFDVDLPEECDDEYWETEDPDKAFIQPEGKPSILSFFVSFLKLLDIIGFAHRTLYSVRKSELWTGMGITGMDWKQKAVVELDSALNKFVDTIPAHLKWDAPKENIIFFQQSAMLYATYYWTQIQVHRPFIPRPGQASVLPFPSLAICSNAARTTVHVLGVLQERRDKDRQFIGLEMVPNILTPLFASALILLVSVWRGRRTTTSTSESEKEMSDVYRCINMIKPYESRYQTAGRICDILNAVVAIGSLPRSAREQTNSLKRPRSPGDDGDQDPNVSNAQECIQDLHDLYHLEEATTKGTNKPKLFFGCHLGFRCLEPIVRRANELRRLRKFPVSLRRSTPNEIIPNTIFPAEPPPVINYSAGLPIGMEFATPQTFNNPMAGRIEPQQHAGVVPVADSMWYPSGNASIESQDEWASDWNLFMASVDDLLLGAVEGHV